MKIPFYSNTADDNHCYEAALKMVLGYFLPDKEYSWNELRKLTGKQEGYWTWPAQALVELQAMGFDVIKMDLFSYQEFIDKGQSYLIEQYGEEVGKLQIDNSDIPHEIKIARKYLEAGIHRLEVPTVSDVKRLLDDGWLLILNINARAFNGIDGYSGHFVVVYDYDDKNIYYHDPGLPPRESQARSFDDFLAGWEAGYPDAKNLQALRFVPKG
jgi:hypothetical protein